MPTLWRTEELIAATGGRLDGRCDEALRGVSIDGRTIEPGEIFVAIKGESRDGHLFVKQAFERGATLAVVSSPVAGATSKPQLVVDDTLGALESLGQAARKRIGGKARIVAVTGSVGKTGTKEMIKMALARSGKTHASKASYNNQWGVPLSLARMPGDIDYGVFEIGMNHAGEIEPLAAMIRPHIALITNVAPVHLGYFANLDEIADAKAEIFTGLERGGIAVLNRDNAYFDLLSDQARRQRCERIIGFGVDERADARLKDADLDDAGSSVRAEILGFDVAYRIGAPGRHLIVNSLAALAVVAAARGDVAAGAREFEDMEPPEGRGRRYPLDVSRGQAMVIDESYNANPASMRAALEVLGAIKLKEHGRRIAVLGDMLELGGQAPELHAALAGPIGRARVDKVFVCGPNMSHLWDVLPDAVKGVYARTSSDLAGIVKSELKTGDVMMIKGSLGAKMGLLVDAVTGRRKNQKEGA